MSGLIKTYRVVVQLGRMAMDERQVILLISAQDEDTAEALASLRSIDEFRKRFGHDAPILNKTRHVVGLEEVA